MRHASDGGPGECGAPGLSSEKGGATTSREDADLFFGDPRFEGSQHPLASRWTHDEEEDEVDEVVQQDEETTRANAIARSVTTTKAAVDAIHEGIDSEEPEAKERAHAMLDSLHSGVTALLLGAHNVASAIEGLVGEVEAHGN